MNKTVFAVEARDARSGFCTGFVDGVVYESFESAEKVAEFMIAKAKRLGSPFIDVHYTILELKVKP